MAKRGVWRRRPAWSLGSVLLLTLVLTLASQARAQEIEPNEFVPAPNGTSLNLAYYVHGSSSNFVSTSGHSIPNSNLEVNVAVERFVHYSYVGGMPAGFQIYQAFGAESGRLGGAGLSSTFGASNTALSAFIWPYASTEKKQYLVLTGFLYPPDGSYDKNKVLNLASALSGSNGWVGDVQVGWDQGIGEHFSYDLALDARFSGDTTSPIQPGIPLSVRSHKDVDLRAQVWLNWAWNRAFTTSIGYQGFFGGNEYFDNPLALGGRGHTNTGSTRLDRIRAAASMFLSKRFQLVLELNHDVTRTGGFRQDYGLNLRGLYVF